MGLEASKFGPCKFSLHIICITYYNLQEFEPNMQDSCFLGPFKVLMCGNYCMHSEPSIEPWALRLSQYPVNLYGGTSIEILPWRNEKRKKHSLTVVVLKKLSRHKSFFLINISSAPLLLPLYLFVCQFVVVDLLRERKRVLES